MAAEKWMNVNAWQYAAVVDKLIYLKTNYYLKYRILIDEEEEEVEAEQMKAERRRKVVLSIEMPNLWTNK